MRVICTYVYPLNGNGGSHHGGGSYHDWAVRFIAGWHEFPSGVSHELLVVCNGHPVTDEAQFLFSSIPNVRFMEHDNSGYDCGAFQHAARDNPCDLMMFFGASAYLRGPGWLSRMVDSFRDHGPALYGAMGNKGDSRFAVMPHIRTTGFCLPTVLMNQYPIKIKKPEERYGFEHGYNCLTSWIYRKGMQAWVVCWDGEYLQPMWDSIPGGYHRGGQENLICGDRLTTPPYHHTP